MGAAAWINVIDVDTIARDRLRRLAETLEVGCHVFDSAEHFLRQRELPRPACLVSEFALPGMSGLELQSSLKEARIDLPVLFLATAPALRDAVQAMQQGAKDVLDKQSTDLTILSGLRSALQEDAFAVRIDRAHHELRARINLLTMKERDVLDLIVQGKPNKSIAKRLGVSVRTVEVRRQHIFRKTQTFSVAQLVQLVLLVRGERPSLVTFADERLDEDRCAVGQSPA